jgi:hypothetical protein
MGTSLAAITRRKKENKIKKVPSYRERDRWAAIHSS